MTSPEAASSGIDRILVVRLSAMGDVIHTLPAVQFLRDAFPESMIGWLIEERWAELLCAAGVPRRGVRSEQRPLVDWVHTVNLRAWRKSLWSLQTVEEIVRVWNDVRSTRYDIAVDLQGAIRSAVLARWSGAPVIYGSAQPREVAASMLYTRPVIPRGRHVVEQNLSIVESVVGRERGVTAVQLPRDPQSEEQIARQFPPIGNGKIAIINPGAGWGAKRWPAERYGAVGRELAGLGVQPLINYGPGEEELARATEAASGGSAKAYRFSVSELIALMRRARLFVGGDTGPLHLAAALQVPVVAIFGPTDPARNGPYGTRSVILRNPASETSHSRKVLPDEAMLEITTDTVIEAARTLLGQCSSGAVHG